MGSVRTVSQRWMDGWTDGRMDGAANGHGRVTGSAIVKNTVDNRELKEETFFLFLVVEIRFVLAMRSPRSIRTYII